MSRITCLFWPDCTLCMYKNSYLYIIVDCIDKLVKNILHRCTLVQMLCLIYKKEKKNINNNKRQVCNHISTCPCDV